MSSESLGVLIVIALFVVIVLYAVFHFEKPPSLKKLDKMLQQKQRELELAQTEKEIAIKEEELELLKNQARKARTTVPSGRGKRFKLR